MATPLLEAIDIRGKLITADALLTQRKLADYLVTQRQADYQFTVKGNQPGVLQDLALYFQQRGEAQYQEFTPPDHPGSTRILPISAYGHLACGRG